MTASYFKTNINSTMPIGVLENLWSHEIRYPENRNWQCSFEGPAFSLGFGRELCYSGLVRERDISFEDTYTMVFIDCIAVARTETSLFSEAS
jgi:hypothetical protein